MVANERSFLDQSSYMFAGSFRELHDLPEITAPVHHFGWPSALQAVAAGAGRIARLEAQKERNGKGCTSDTLTAVGSHLPNKPEATVRLPTD